MTLKVPTASENKLLEYMLGKSTPANLTLKLYVNNKTPADADAASDYTEMSTNSYASKTLTMASWSVAQNGSAKAEASYAQQSWTFTAGGPVTVYGYFVVDSGGVLLWAEKFDSGKVVEFSGDVIRVTPKFTLSSEA